MTAKAIQSAALKLPVEARSRLAAALLASLEEADESGLERAWVEEAERRFKEFQAGRTKATSAKEAIAEIRAGLR